jgi:hypothetical protein
MSRSSWSSSSPAAPGVIGTSGMPHFGHEPGPSWTTSGCIGQVYLPPIGAAAAAGDAAVCSCFTYRAGSALNFCAQPLLQK